jgi:hypothetical protein
VAGDAFANDMKMRIVRIDQRSESEHPGQARRSSNGAPAMLKSHVFDGLLAISGKLFFTVKDRRSKL